MIPDIQCEIKVVAPLYPSEDPTKVAEAIQRIFVNVDTVSNNSSISARSTDLAVLSTIFDAIRAKRSQRVYMKNLKRNLHDNTTWFYLNKQAAFVGKTVICAESDESPLGPIKVSISSPDIDDIVEWLVSS